MRSWTYAVAIYAPLICFVGCTGKQGGSISERTNDAAHRKRETAEKTDRASTDGAIQFDKAPSAESPLVAKLQAPPQVWPGTTASLTISCKLAPGWHIYALDKAARASVPTRIELELPAGLTSDGDWEYPEPMLQLVAGEPIYIYEDAVAFRTELQVDSDVEPRKCRIACRLYFQTCNAFTCQPPDMSELSADVEVVQQ